MSPRRKKRVREEYEVREPHFIESLTNAQLMSDRMDAIQSIDVATAIAESYNDDLRVCVREDWEKSKVLHDFYRHVIDVEKRTIKKIDDEMVKRAREYGEGRAIVNILREAGITACEGVEVHGGLPSQEEDEGVRIADEILQLLGGSTASILDI